MENITAKIEKKTRKVYLSKSIIGNDGENLQEKLVFSFIDEFVNGIARLELNRNNTKSYIMLTKVDNTYELPIKSIITKVGKLDLQLVITEGTNENEIPIFKSNVFFVIVNPSINAEIEQPEEYPQWIDVANAKINLIDEKLDDIDEAITETNNLDLDVSKSGKIATVTLTKKDTTTKTVTLSDGTSLMFNWDGTRLGIKTDEDIEYTYVDLQGVQGPVGPKGEAFTIKKTYTSVAEMNADFNNMQLGDYVMIASTVEVEDNAKLYTRGESQWIFISDFSGSQGIRGETGLTPNIQIGTVITGQTSSVTRTGTNENPILNFTLVKGDKGDTGQTGATGATGNGIASITKTGTSGLVDTYTITYTNGTTTTFDVTNGEDGEVTQTQFDKLEHRVEDLETNQSTDTVSGTNIEINDAHETEIVEGVFSKESTQDGTPTPENPVEIKTIKNSIKIMTTGKQLFKDEYLPIPNSNINANLKKGTYCLSTVDGQTFNANLYIKLSKNGNIVTEGGHLTGLSNYSSGSYNYYGAAGISYLIFTIDDDYDLYIGLLNSDNTRQVVLVEGTTVDRNYEPYKGNIVTIPLNGNEIVGIGDYKDELIIDRNGHCWLNKKTGKVALDGSESGWINGSTSNYSRFTLPLVNANPSSSRSICLSNYFKYISSGHTYSGCFISSRNVYLYPDIEINLLEEWYLWLSTHNTEIYYPLETPELIDLNYDVDVRLLNGLSKISNSEDMDMTIKYVVDIDDILDSKQDTLVSGTNIKTINNQSILGEGNISVGGGSGGTSDYTDLENKPQINNVTLSGNKSLSDLGIQPEGNYYTKPAAGIPDTDLSSAVQTSLGKADTAIQSSDLSNYVQNSDYATLNTAGIMRASNGLSVSPTNGVSYVNTYTNEQYNSLANGTFIGKGTLENVITGKQLVNQTYVDNLIGDINTILATLTTPSNGGN